MQYTFTTYDFDTPSLLFKLEDILKGFIGFLLYNPFIKLFQIRGNEHILDFGCGGGAGAKCIAKQLNHNGFLTCSDVSQYWIKKAKKRLSKYKNINCLLGDIRELNIPDNSFDIISIVHVIHDIHPDERQAIVHSLFQKLKDTGKLFIYEPTRPSHGISIDEIRTHLTKAGLEEIKNIIKKSNYIGQYEKKSDS